MANISAAEFSTLPFDEKMKIWVEISDLTEAEIAAKMNHENERQAGVPQPGAAAPDFEIDILDRARKRSGETVSLSSLLGKPVGLIFGSYT